MARKTEGAMDQTRNFHTIKTRGRAMNQLPRLLACLVVAIVIVMAGLAGPPAWAERPHDETRDAVNDARSDRQDFPDSPSESAMVDAARFSDDTVQKLDEVVAREMQEKNLPGVVVGVWVPGEGRYLVARGVANLETGRPRRLHDPFRIASITKTFTATAILQLIDKGKLSKSDTVSKWLPDFTNADLSPSSTFSGCAAGSLILPMRSC